VERARLLRHHVPGEGTRGGVGSSQRWPYFRHVAHTPLADTLAKDGVTVRVQYQME